MSTERQTKSNPASICDLSSIFRKINRELFHSRGLSFIFYSTSWATGGFVMNSNLELRGRVWFRLVCCFSSELRGWKLVANENFGASDLPVRFSRAHSIFINVLSKKRKKPSITSPRLSLPKVWKNRFASFYFHTSPTHTTKCRILRWTRKASQ